MYLQGLFPYNLRIGHHITEVRVKCLEVLSVTGSKNYFYFVTIGDML